MRTRWTPEVIESELRSVASSLGRMPSYRDLVALGRRPLAVAVGKHGSYPAWAARIGAEPRDSTTRRGRAYEDHVASVLAGLGRATERQTTKAPFDLLVDGRVRVDVKGARWHAYPMSSDAPAIRAEGAAAQRIHDLEGTVEGQDAKIREMRDLLREVETDLAMLLRSHEGQFMWTSTPVVARHLRAIITRRFPSSRALCPVRALETP